MHRIARRLAVLGLLPLGVTVLAPPAANAEHGAQGTPRGAQTAAAAGTSAAPATADRGYITWKGATTWARQQQVRGYWNRSRLVSAQPMDLILSRSRRSSGNAGTGARASVGQASIIPPTTGQQSLGNSNRQTDAAVWPGTGAVATTAGRVFFTIDQGGRQQTASCSGTAVTSNNRSVVITAGHCVKSGGRAHRNVVFVPGFDRGRRPFGTWVATNLFTTVQWNANEDINFDIAAFVVAPQNGRNLVDVVGGQGIAFNQQRRQQMYSFGYPAAAPFDGSRLIFCAGRAIDDPVQTNDLGLRCRMTGGSSGGPWFLAFNERTGAGVVNSVNSFKYDFNQNFMFGPFFGQEAQAVYNAAQNTGAQ